MTQKRLFTFGCSFTSYHWPTWADIVGLEYDVYENWGQSGGGNHFIFYSLIECIKRKNISSADTVAIMWTSPARHDAYIDGKWVLSGGVYMNSHVFNDAYIKQWADPTGYYLTSASLVDATVKILKSIGCKFYFMSMTPMALTPLDDEILPNRGHLPNVEKDVTDLFKDTLSIISPSVLDVIFNGDWISRNNFSIPFHNSDSVKSLQEKYNSVAGPSWPSFDDFYNENLNGVDIKILNEIRQGYQLEKWRQEIKSTRKDFHPTPAEHLEYLEKIKIFAITLRQKEYVTHWNNIVLTEKNIGFSPSQVERF